MKSSKEMQRIERRFSVGFFIYLFGGVLPVLTITCEGQTEFKYAFLFAFIPIQGITVALQYWTEFVDFENKILRAGCIMACGIMFTLIFGGYISGANALLGNWSKVEERIIVSNKSKSAGKRKEFRIEGFSETLKREVMYPVTIEEWDRIDKGKVFSHQVRIGAFKVPYRPSSLSLWLMKKVSG